MKQLLLIFTVLFSAQLFSQSIQLSGLIVDKENKETLAFVNLTYNSDNNGTTTNIDGKFSIISENKIEYLKASFLGYETLIIPYEEIDFSKSMLIEMTKSTINLSEAVVLPGINPAHRIINQAVKNRDLNNPEKMKSFSYASYNKLFFTLDNRNKTIKNDTLIKSDSLIHKIKERKALRDSSAQKAVKDTNSISSYLEKYHFFIMESVSLRKFIYPDKNNEKVIATRVSGLKQPSIMLLATQLQSFSFYNEQINISDRNYLNPISEGSTSKYFFLIEDTLFSEENDTVFIISYRPLKGKNFEGLKGILHINTNKYAVQSVIAEPSEPQKTFNVKIQQNYKLIDSLQWFPWELNTDLLMTDLQIFEKRDTLILNDSTIIKQTTFSPMIGIGKTYLGEINLNPEIEDKEFSTVEVEVNDDAHEKDENFWKIYRYDSLTAIDQNTYRLIDSIGKAEKLDLKFRLIETISQGFIPWKFFNIDYRSILQFNSFEGYRTGIGLVTNEKISRYFSVGGNFAYGFRDKVYKYGGNVNILLDNAYDTRFKISCNYDVNETGGYEFLNDNMVLGTDLYRNLMVDYMQYEKSLRFDFQHTLIKYLQTDFFISYTETETSGDYIFSRYPTLEQTLELPFPYSFNVSAAGIQLRYSYKEKFMKTPRGYKISMGTDYPVIWLNLTRSLSLSEDEPEFTKTEIKISKSFLSKNYGKFSLQFLAGYSDGALPLPLQFNGHASYRPWVVESGNSFATARMNEFFNSEFLFLFLRHDFSSLLFKKGGFQPKIILCHNTGIGRLNKVEYHYGETIQDMHKGYLESGLLINNIINQSFFGYGLGFFYRYGPYAYPESIDNFAGKFTIYLYL